MSSNTAYFDRVRYILDSNHLDSIIILEPKGWNDDEKEYARHEKYHGIMAKFSNSLKFIGKGADYIQFILDVYGLNEDIRLTREEKHPRTNEWTQTYTGYLDLSTWERENNEISIKFNSGGLEQLLKSRENDKFEIDRETTVDGKTIAPLNPITVELESRRIFLKTNYKQDSINNSAALSNFSNGNTRGCTVPVPLNLINKSHENAQSPIPGTYVLDNSWERWGVGETGLMFFAVSDRRRTLRIKFNLKFTVFCSQFDDVNSFAFHCRLAHYQGGVAYTNKYNHTLLHIPNNFNGIDYDTYSVNFDQDVIVEPGDSLALIFDQIASLGSNTSRGHLDINVINVECNMYVDENSFFEKTNSKAVLLHEVGERLVNIATNKENAFYSDFLGRTDIGYPVNGKGGLLAITHGFWIRNFDKLPIPTEGPPKVENMFKPLTTSFKDFAESLNVVWNTGIGIEKKGFKERVRLEELSFFYNKTVTIRLPNQVTNVKRKIAVKDYFSSLEFGYKEGGTYEEACGLDEFNAKSTFTTIINRLKATYTKISEYAADSYGMEFIRRKQKNLNNTQDTPRDNSIWFLDLKVVGAFFKQRKWQEDCEQIPTGVFSPETATGLRLSPLNCLLRHAWNFGGGLIKYSTDYVRYASSTANSQLKTKLIGGIEYAENGNIINSELQKARFIPEEIEFEHICDFDIMQKVNGTTIVLGKEIMNYYGLVEFTNEKNETERGFLMNLKPNGKGQWKVLKSNT